MEDLAEARGLVRAGDFRALEMLYDNIPNALSELIRTAFVPKPGYKFVVSDFGAIKARVLSFLARRQWRIEVFEQRKDIFCSSAMKTLCRFFIVGSVHDELIIECPPDTDLQSVCEQMGRTPPWIPGLLLRADGYECEFYK